MTVAGVLLSICSGASDHDAVNVGSLEVGFQRTFGKFDSVLPEFAKINRAAYWDYQRAKVYLRTDKTIRRTIRKSQHRSKTARVEQEVTLEHVPEECPNLRKNPFDDELKVIANRFGALLREIVETIDTHGLKARHLSKHRGSAEAFIEHVVAMKCATEAGLALKKRIEKNRNKLFTFLNYDGVPWNNNNAEHAVRAFTRLRNVINTSTPKGTHEFATLLSIQQTLRYRGMNLLGFMRSGRMEIEG